LYCCYRLYVIEIRSNYVTESLPIALGALTNKSSVNTVTIRPHSSISSAFTISTGTAASVFNFTAGDYVSLDGRVSSTGSTSLLVIENTQTAASKYAIQFSGSSTNNTIKYCTLKGSNSDSNYPSSAPGVVFYGTGTNNNNTIDNCTIKQSGSNYPYTLVNSNGGTNQVSITNCQLVNFKQFGVLSGDATNLNWTITGNSFYADYAQSGWTNPVSMVKIMDGGGHTITGNYFGGRSAQCGGSAYTLSSDRELLMVDYTWSTAGYNNIISGNTINNIAYTSTRELDQWSTFYASGDGNFTIGSSGNGNIIGSTSGTGGITITDNATTSSASEYLFSQFLLTQTLALNTM
jgi:hypothetical protein